MNVIASRLMCSTFTLRSLTQECVLIFQGDPIRVLVSGAAGQIAYSLLYSIAKGDVFGKDQVSTKITWGFSNQNKTSNKPFA